MHTDRSLRNLLLPRHPPAPPSMQGKLLPLLGGNEQKLQARSSKQFFGSACWTIQDGGFLSTS